MSARKKRRPGRDGHRGPDRKGKTEKFDSSALLALVDAEIARIEPNPLLLPKRREAALEALGRRFPQPGKEDIRHAHRRCKEP